MTGNKIIKQTFVWKGCFSLLQKRLIFGFMNIIMSTKKREKINI
jgi:hypothetical protein